MIGRCLPVQNTFNIGHRSQSTVHNSVADPDILQDPDHFAGSGSFSRIQIILLGSGSFCGIGILFPDPDHFVGFRIILRNPENFPGSWSFFGSGSFCRIRIILSEPDVFVGSGCFCRIRIILQDPALTIIPRIHIQILTWLIKNKIVC